MRRRKIKINGKKAITLTERFAAIKDAMKEKFRDTPVKTQDKFIEFIMSSGFDLTSYQSVNTQFNGGNPRGDAIQAFTMFSEHALDFLRMQQGVYTDFKDTAATPNFALRFPAETETIFRRITVADTVMLRASQTLEAIAANQVRAQDLPDYWKQLWGIMLNDILPRNVDVHVLDKLLYDPLAAVATACEFCLSVREQRYEEITFKNLQETFMRPGSAFDTGVFASKENIRQPNSDHYRMCYRFDEIPDMSTAHFDLYYAAAVQILLYGLDDKARATMLRGSLKTGQLTDTFYTWLSSFDVGSLPAYVMTDETNRPPPDVFEEREEPLPTVDIGGESFEIETRTTPIPKDEADHGNQETQEHPTAAIDPHRLLP